MALFKFKPSRLAAQNDSALPIVDLDQIIAEPIYFRFQGTTHKLRPINTAEFLMATQSLAKMDALRKKDEIKQDELISAYASLISSVCDSIGVKEIYQMTQAQLGALVQLILDHLQGKAGQDLKKKQVTQSEQPETSGLTPLS